ncbi:MAG: Spy/CpxP family protein refolding chaperone [bacterium]
MRHAILILCILMFAPCQILRAQPHPADPFDEFFFPPELVMQHQQEINLSQEQRNFIKEEIQKAQQNFTEWQWELQSAMETMRSLVKETQVDEQKVLNQLEEVLKREREIKRAQLSLMIRIKNELTPNQQELLQTLKKKPRPQ